MKSHSLLGTVANRHRHCAQLLDNAQPAVLLLVRLVWGFQFAQTGWGKWQGIPKVVDFFSEIGIPLPVLSAYLVATTELVCGILLIVGLLSRLASVLLVITMIVAYVTTEQEALGQVFKTLDPVLTAAPFLFLFASLLILIFGPGRYSPDHWIARKKWGTE